MLYKEGFILKIIIASTGRDLNSEVSPIFGRSRDFITVELENGEIKNIEATPNLVQKEKGAGNLAAQYLVDNHVETLITGKLGNVSFRLLKKDGIKIYKASPGTVDKNIKLFQQGKLKEINSIQGGF